MIKDDIHNKLFEQIKPIIKGKMEIYRPFVFAFICGNYHIALCMLCNLDCAGSVKLAAMLLKQTCTKVLINSHYNGRTAYQRAMRTNARLMLFLLEHHGAKDSVKQPDIALGG